MERELYQNIDFLAWGGARNYWTGGFRSVENSLKTSVSFVFSAVLLSVGDGGPGGSQVLDIMYRSGLEPFPARVA